MAVTGKRARFVQEYLLDLNKTQAAIRAGYSAKTAYVTGYQLSKEPEIAALIEEGMRNRAERLGVTQDWVLLQLRRIAGGDLRKLYRDDGTLKQPQELDDDTAAALAGIEVAIENRGRDEEPALVRKYKRVDPVKSLELLGKHLGMFADTTNHKFPEGLPVPVINVTIGNRTQPGAGTDAGADRPAPAPEAG